MDTWQGLVVQATCNSMILDNFPPAANVLTCLIVHIEINASIHKFDGRLRLMFIIHMLMLIAFRYGRISVAICGCDR